MKLRDIEVGKTYEVLIPEHVDVSAWHARRYDRRPTYGKVVEVGVHYDVPRRVTYGGISGTPRALVGWNASERADGVKVSWDDGRKVGVVPARNVKWEVKR